MATKSTGFVCNICGDHSLVPTDLLQRESASCQTCGSSPRTRAIVRALSLSLFGKNLVLGDFPADRALKGLGMSDWEGYAVILADKFGYTNTYYHKNPRLDIGNPEIPEFLLQSNDFIVSSEVFEHVTPPVSKAFENTFRMLKPGGCFILTVPYGNQAKTIEHFPALHDFEVIADNGNHRLRNVTRSGEVQEFHTLVFHGGPGATLEMRVFAKRALIKHLTEAGFEAITVCQKPDPSHGIWWPEPWSFPLSAKRPRQ